jgi:putative peptide zinc metalloprotease protein
VLAIWGVGLQVVLPILKALGFVMVSPRLARCRLRALATTGFGVGGAAALLFLLPVNSWTVAEGVVWLPERSHLRAGTEGFVHQVLVQPDSWVKVGEPIIECEDPTLESEARVLEARIRELRLRYRHQRANDIALAQQIEEELRAAESELSRTNERRDALTIRASIEGMLVIHRPQDLPGRFLKQGDSVGYVIDGPSEAVRVVVPQGDADLVKSRTLSAEVRLAYKSENLLLADLQRAMPSATDRLPAKSLGTAGGGRVPVDPMDEEGLRSTEKLFQFDVALPRGAPTYYFGQRAHVRFEHGDQTLAAQWFRSLRQLFLARFQT